MSGCVSVRKLVDRMDAQVEVVRLELFFVEPLLKRLFGWTWKLGWNNPILAGDGNETTWEVKFAHERLGMLAENCEQIEFVRELEDE